MGSVTNAEEWSDSDDEVEAEVETSVLLGVPDGHVDAAADISDAAVSRIGGHPVRLGLVCVSRVICSLTLLMKGISPIVGALHNNFTM